MRIIAGEKRGLKLITPPDQNIRPTTDRVKEAMFGSLQFDVPGAVVLDLFAGSGALGLEAASRGAKNVVLVESNAASIRVIEQNIRKMGSPAGVELVKNDAFRTIKLFQNARKFDIVFVDPPYADMLYQTVLDTLVESGVLAENALVVLESAGETGAAASGLEPFKSKKYGSTWLTYFRYMGEDT